MLKDVAVQSQEKRLDIVATLLDMVNTVMKRCDALERRCDELSALLLTSGRPQKEDRASDALAQARGSVPGTLRGAQSDGKNARRTAR